MKKKLDDKANKVGNSDKAAQMMHKFEQIIRSKNKLVTIPTRHMNKYFKAKNFSASLNF